MTIQRFIRVETGDMALRCGYEEACDHLPRYQSEGEYFCACHAPVEELKQRPDLLKEAIEYAALESEDFEVDAEGMVKLRKGVTDER